MARTQDPGHDVPLSSPALCNIGVGEFREFRECIKRGPGSTCPAPCPSSRSVMVYPFGGPRESPPAWCWTGVGGKSGRRVDLDVPLGPAHTTANQTCFCGGRGVGLLCGL